MKYLQERGLDTVIRNLQQPVLGICLGMQLMCAHSEENDTRCLGIFEETVKRFVPDAAAASSIKVPQVGWNNVYGLNSPLFKEIPDNSYCYFVHSYYAALGQHTIGTTYYIQPYSSALHKGNFYGVQFHPEKSAAIGEKIIRNFINL
ncbi:MAG: hisH, partial [Sediminibacterium sp.]|nr:hisH [Sediminibacterium sp.]